MTESASETGPSAPRPPSLSHVGPFFLSPKRQVFQTRWYFFFFDVSPFILINIEDKDIILNHYLFGSRFLLLWFISPFPSDSTLSPINGTCGAVFLLLIRGLIGWFYFPESLKESILLHYSQTTTAWINTAVCQIFSRNSTSLHTSSRRNRRLWQCPSIHLRAPSLSSSIPKAVVSWVGNSSSATARFSMTNR